MSKLILALLPVIWLYSAKANEPCEKVALSTLQQIIATNHEGLVEFGFVRTQGSLESYVAMSDESTYSIELQSNGCKVVSMNRPSSYLK